MAGVQLDGCAPSAATASREPLPGRRFAPSPALTACATGPGFVALLIFNQNRRGVRPLSTGSPSVILSGPLIPVPGSEHLGKMKVHVGKAGGPLASVSCPAPEGGRTEALEISAEPYSPASGSLSP